MVLSPTADQLTILQKFKKTQWTSRSHTCRPAVACHATHATPRERIPKLGSIRSTIIYFFRRKLRWRSFAHHYHGDEAHSRRKHHVPGRRQRIASRVYQPGDDQLRGAAEGGDGDGIDRGEGAPTDVLGQALRERHIESAVGNGANQ